MVHLLDDFLEDMPFLAEYTYSNVRICVLHRISWQTHGLSGVVVGNDRQACCCTVAVQTITLPMTHSAQASLQGV